MATGTQFGSHGGKVLDLTGDEDKVEMFGINHDQVGIFEMKGNLANRYFNAYDGQEIKIN